MRKVTARFDLDLLKLFDAEDEVKRRGRSAVLRKAVKHYLRRSPEVRLRDRSSRA